VFRIHDFIPTFNKYAGTLCHGLQVHVTSPEKYYPVGVALDIFDSIIKTSVPEAVQFNPPPYEYEKDLMPFDILSGDQAMRISLLNRQPVGIEKERWQEETEEFRKEFMHISAYPE
jgi:uncharacterized protein YbbC (DUF1343 family)